MFPLVATIPTDQRLIIREAVASDAADVLLHLKTVGAETDFLSFAPKDIKRSLESQAKLITESQAADNHLYIVAEINHQLVGGLHFRGQDRPRTRHSGTFGITVLKDYWGLGIGHKLIEALIKWAQRSGVIRKINLKVRSDNHRALRLYETLGFIREGCICREYCLAGKFYDNVCMGLEID